MILEILISTKQKVQLKTKRMAFYNLLPLNGVSFYHRSHKEKLSGIKE